MKVKKSTLIITTQCILFLLIALIANKSMFDEGVGDGFYSQISYAYLEIAAGPTHALYFVHLFRLIIVLPFYLIYINDLPVFLESLVLLLFMIPVLTFKKNSNHLACGFIFIFLPWLFSFRSVLVMCGMAYLYMSFMGNSRRVILYGFSALLANLSSGVVLAWLIVNFLCVKTIKVKYKSALIVFVVGLVGFILSFIDKIEHFFKNSGGPENEGLLTNNTFYISFFEGDYLRLAVYLSLAFMLWLHLITAAYYKNSDQKFLFFMLAALPTLFFEGIGLISFLYIFIWGLLVGIPVKKNGLVG